MKTIKSILVILVLVVTANVGFAQKNIYLHEGANVYKSTSEKTDSITFGDYKPHGTFIMSNYDTLTPRKFSMDSHSKIVWDATYKGVNAPISGGFGVMATKILFDAANPQNIKFDVQVDLSSVVTFELGREGLDHCVVTNIGVVTAQTGTTPVSYIENASAPTGFDTIPGKAIWAITDSLSNWATMVCTPGNVVFKGDGYEAQAQFTFRGVTTTVPVYFEYLGSNVRTGTNLYQNFEGSFEFQAGLTASDPYYCGSNIKSKVKVKLHLIMRDDS
jgi:polyisoprenoid-binding protein YceI